MHNGQQQGFSLVFPHRYMWEPLGEWCFQYFLKEPESSKKLWQINIKDTSWDEVLYKKT